MLLLSIEGKYQMPLYESLFYSMDFLFFMAFLCYDDDDNEEGEDACRCIVTRFLRTSMSSSSS